ncbi:MAG: transposase [Anaerolineaceae bacterium]|jgi:putative transposase
MPEYRRSILEGGTFFFTVVTYNRRPILTTPVAREILHSAWITVQERFPFKTDAVCLLPEHIHCIWTLPEGDSNYSVRWKEIKRLFTRDYTYQVGPGKFHNKSHQKQREATIWQRRFWEHTIQNQEDFAHHIEYIFFNPVKHGLVERVSEWPWSSFHQFVRQGFYPKEWGGSEIREEKDMIFGE